MVHVLRLTFNVSYHGDNILKVLSLVLTYLLLTCTNCVLNELNNADRSLRMHYMSIWLGASVTPMT